MPVYTKEQKEHIKLGLSLRLGKDPVSIGIKSNGSIQYALQDPKAIMDGQMPRTDTPLFVHELLRNEVLKVMSEGRQYERKQKLLQNPEESLMKLGHKLYGSVPVEVNKSDDIILLNFKSGSYKELSVQEARNVLEDYLKKEEIIAGMELKAMRTGIIGVEFDRLYKSGISLKQVEEIRESLESAIRDYTYKFEIDTPDNITYLNGTVVFLNGKAQLVLEPVVNGSVPRSKEDRNSKHLADRRTLKSMEKLFSEE